MRSFRHLALSAAPLCLLAGPAAAHPHVWVDYDLVSRFEGNAIVALTEEWSFDEDFSASVLTDEARHHGKAPLTAAEVARLKTSAFSNLRNYDYFTHVWAGKTRIGVNKDVTAFDARLDGDRLVYRFTVTLAHPVDPHAGPVLVGVWDDTYYVDVGPVKDHKLSLEGDGATGCRASVIEDKSHPIYYGSVFPPAVKISC